MDDNTQDSQENSGKLLAAEISGLDALESSLVHRKNWVARIWKSIWPKCLALFLVVFFWQIVVWLKWKPDYVFPGPFDVFTQLKYEIHNGRIFTAIGITFRRAIFGFALSTIIGIFLGIIVVKSRYLRSAIGSLITGLQTMPSIAWFPLAILLFKISEEAITFVVVIGATPAIANGIIAGIDGVPPLFFRVSKILGANEFQKYLFILIPAALPSVLAGLKQGWAFAWRSLMAGELLVIVAKKPSLGALLQNARDLSDSRWLMAIMIVILFLGVLVDSIFSFFEKLVLRQRGLLQNR